MSGQIELVVTLTPKPGKMEEIIETLQHFNKYVELKEPGTLRFELFKQINSETGTEHLVYIEVYKNAAAREEHAQSETYKMIQEKSAELELLAAPLEVKLLEHVGGFGARAG